MQSNKKRFLFQLNHPAHYHLFKNTIAILKDNGHQLLISIKDKDILKDLVKDLDHVQISTGYRKNSFYSIIASLISRNKQLYKLTKLFKPDLMIGTSPEIGQISKITNIPALFFGEDDVNLSTTMYLGALTCYPLFDAILSPTGVNNSFWNNKTFFYNSFQKLAYLHPNRFLPDRDKVDIPLGDKYFLLRFSNLNAYHDVNASGISDSIALQLIELLIPKGKVFISSERPLPERLQPYIFTGDIQDIHHYLYYSSLYIGDSQSMAVEAAMLGTPNIRFSNFVNKISILKEIEYKYKLSVGIDSSDPSKLFSVVKEIINNPVISDIYADRTRKIIEDKIDVTAFMVWFIENYPLSAKIMKENPNYQYNFS